MFSKRNLLHHKQVLVLLVLLLPLSLWAQKKQIQAARDQVKSGKELAKAVASMQGLLTDSANRHNPRIWMVLCDALTAQYEQGNEKLYLGQATDTTALFAVTKRLFDTMSAFDSIDVKSDTKGKVRAEHRQRNAAYLNTIRPNLFNGGVFYTRKKAYEEAYRFYETYIQSAHWPLFTGYDYVKIDPLLPHAAYWAMYCGFKMGSAERIIRYQELAERDTSMLNFVRQYQAEAFLLQKDTARYVNALRDGFARYPNFSFFYPRLIAYYERHGLHDSSLVVADKALEADSTSVLFRLTKSSILLNLGRYDECIALCTGLLAQNDSLPEAYYYIGLAYFNQAIALDKVVQRNRKEREKIIGLYKEALPYLERFRALAPDERERWLQPLYTIYLNLNMGEEFDEINNGGF